jgi:orotidine-5'-phosphate decarboxylase
MVVAAAEGARIGASDVGLQPPAIVAVTVLTSMDDEALSSVGVGRSAAEQVALLAGVARDGGADGVVCSPKEAAMMRQLLGEGAFVVTPGVRPQGAGSGDQARIATPAQALAVGASHVVANRSPKRRTRLRLPRR